jgi:peptidyl-prolyl cis-trans isomerase C
VALGCAGTITMAGILACSKKENQAQATGGAARKPDSPPTFPDQSADDLKEVVATIDSTTITVKDLQDRINRQSPYVRAKYTSLEQKKDFVDNLIRFEVLAGEAKRRGYDQDADVVQTMKQVMIQKLMKDEFETRVKLEDVPEDEIKKFYEDHKAEYNKPEEVRVSAVIVKKKDVAQKAAEEAKQPANQDNKAFRDLVTKYSEDEETKGRGGDLRFFAADTKDVPADVVKAAFTLQNQGDTAGPIATDKGFYVIKQSGRRKAITKTYEEVKGQIQNRLYREKRQKAMEDFVAGLKKNAKIEIKDAALSKVRIDTSQPPPAVPGEPTLVPPMGGPPRTTPPQTPPPGPVSK